MVTPDYDQIIDAQTWSFIHETNSFYAGLPKNPSIQQQRQAYDAMCAAFHRPHPDDVLSHDETIAGVPVRHYAPSAPSRLIVYLHGGSFVLGGLHSHDDICAEIASLTGRRVASVDYRLAPEHLHPAAYHDAMTTTLALADRFGPVIMVGDSAGASLAASVAHKLRGSETVAGVALIYPTLGGNTDSPSMLAHAHAPLLSRDEVRQTAANRFRGPVPTADVTAFALADTDFSGLPPTHVFSAECDPLADDGRIYAERINKAGAKAYWTEDKGLIHGWLRARHSVPRAKAAFAGVVAAIRTL